MFSVLHSSIRQPLRQRPERVASMCDVQLVFFTDSRKGLSVRRVIEDRVVPEAAATLGRGSDFAFDGASRFVHHHPVADDGDGADEPRGAGRIRTRREAPVDLGKPLGITGVGPQKAGRIDARLAVQRVDDDAGILRHRIEGTALRRGRRLRDDAVVLESLDARVVLEGRSRLVRFRNGREVAKAQKLNRQMAEKAPNLAQLVCACRRDEQAEQGYFFSRYWPTNPRWSAISWRIPVSARSSI